MADLSALEVQKLHILASIESWSSEQINFSPGPGEWSALQVLDHIVRSEAGIQTHVRTNLERPHPIGIRDRLGVRFIDRIFRSERRVKVPGSAKAVLPGSTLSLNDIQHSWHNARKDLADLLIEVGPCRLGLFRHPVAGWMTMPQVLGFFEVHVIHHGFQLRRLAKACLAG